MSTVNLLHYREWHGRLRGAWASIWPITRVALGTLLRRKLFWALYLVTLLLFLMFFFGTFLLNWLETQLSGPIQFGTFKADPDRVMQNVRTLLSVLQGNHHTFAYFFIYQGSAVMVVLTFTGAVLVGNDIVHRSLAFYLAKPLSRWHYIGGKVLAVAVVVNLLVTLPALLLFAQHGLDDLTYFVDAEFFSKTAQGGPGGVELLLGIIGFGLVLSVFLGLLLVATATWAKRTMPLVVLWTTLFMFIRLLTTILVDRLQYAAQWRLLDLWNDLCLVGFALLGFEESQIHPQPQPAFGEAGLVLVGVAIACLIYLNQRTRAVEVIR
jgi:ABC-2 type transport system permease protein